MKKYSKKMYLRKQRNKTMYLRKLREEANQITYQTLSYLNDNNLKRMDIIRMCLCNIDNIMKKVERDETSN